MEIMMIKQRKEQKLKGKEFQRYREAHYHAWKESGLTQKAYCEAAGLSQYIFNNWRHKQKEKDSSEQEPTSGFIPLRVVEETPVSEAAPLHVTLPGNVGVIVREGFNAPLLRQVIEALRP
jgi:hypothetical protein